MTDWQRQIAEILRSLLNGVDGFDTDAIKFGAVSAGKNGAVSASKNDAAGKNGEVIETVSLRCPKTFGVDLDCKLRSALPINSVHFFGNVGPGWNPFDPANKSGFDLIVAQGSGFQGILRAARTKAASLKWDTERIISELETIQNLEIDVLFADTTFFSADFIYSSNQYESVANELKRICPEVYVGKGFKPNASSLAKLLEQDEANLTFSWPESTKC